MTLLHDDRVDLLPVFWLLDSALVKKLLQISHFFGNTIWENLHLPTSSGP